MGLPGSGKSAWCARQGLPALSSDEMRRLLWDDPEQQGDPWRVFAALRLLLRYRLETRRPVTVIDATNLMRWERRPYIELARLHDCDVEAVYFDVPAEVCRARNAARHRVVPEDVIGKMAARLEPPTVEEGFVSVTVVRG